MSLVNNPIPEIPRSIRLEFQPKRVGNTVAITHYHQSIHLMVDLSKKSTAASLPS